MSARWTLSAGVAAFLAAFVLAPPAYSHKPITTNLIFKREIAQIFQRKCFQCHSDKNLAMSLTTYELARPWARAIREEIIERKMPPWSAVSGFGHFANDISLTQRETDMILSWADGGAPSGVLKVEESIPPVYVPTSPEWTLGPPDLVLQPAEAQVIEAESPVKNVRIEVPTGFSEKRSLRAVAFRPGDRRVVRSVAFHEAGTGRWLGAYTPWQSSMTLPTGITLSLAPKSRIVMDVTYDGTDETVRERGEIGLYFAGPTTGTSASQMVVSAPAFNVPAGASAHRVRTVSVVDRPSKAFAIWPDLSDQARSIEVSAIDADGVVTPLLLAKDYRHDWPSPYLFSSPVALAKGTKIAVTSYFENESDRPQPARAQITLLRY